MDPKTYEVFLGAHERNGNGAMKASINKIVRHPNFRDNDNDNDPPINDVAIMFLSQPITFNDNIIPICLPKSDAPDEKSCEATGWGFLSAAGWYFFN